MASDGKSSVATAAAATTTTSTSTSTLTDNAATNPRGIPLAPFVDRVEDYVASRDQVEGTLKSFQEMISKYQFMETNTQKRLDGLKDKIPDIKKTLDMVQFLQTRTPESEPLETTFELNDTLYAKALVPHTDEVYLWLGANVMLSYPLPEATDLLTDKLRGARQKLADCEEDIDFLREQITTLEVATARVYNWDVTKRRLEREAGGDAGAADAQDAPTNGAGSGAR